MPFLSDIRAMILAGLLAMCAVVSAVQTVRLHGFLWIDGALDRAERLESDNNELRAAAREAEAMNKAEVAKRESEQEQINEDVVSDLERDLARLHDELRRQAAKGNSGKPGVSQAPASPQGAAPATGLCLSPTEHVRAAENELRHDALIDWAERVEKWWNEQPSPDRSR